ncbi:probable metal-nicotianamine transporter YSL7 [Helianthus annuus]|uniref:probable metal-nicotianamine transporter YSL7 n=1 Tax=Helianthus annuus TaxID=4232 RepID=UPI001652FB94|nr:probable metal-nicotianamine transporter YSL7 [Helianthus annuus]
MILGDGLYNFIKVLYYTLSGLYRHFNDNKTKSEEAIIGNSLPDLPSLSCDDQKRTRLFLNDQIPTWIAIVGYLTISIVSIIILPHIFHQLKWYYVAAIYVCTPILAFCNAFGCGLTDWSLASTYRNRLASSFPSRRNPAPPPEPPRVRRPTVDSDINIIRNIIKQI